MPRRFLLTLAMMCGLAVTGLQALQAQDEESNESINDKVMRQVEKALKKFEGDLEKGKIESIMQRVEQVLGGKSMQMQWFGEMPEGIVDAKNLPKHLKILRKQVGEVDGELGDLVPHLIELSNAQIVESGDRKVVGVVLESTDDKVVVQKVIEESPAEKAGVKSGDIIIKVDGKKITDPQGLIAVIKESDEDVKFSVKRDGKVMQIKVTPESASSVPGFNRSIIRFSKDGDLDMEDFEGLIELKGADLEGIQERLIEGVKGNIFEFAPGKKGDKMELRIKGKADAKSKKTMKSKKRETDVEEIVEEAIEVEEKGSKTSDAIEKLQKQLERLEKEISKLKKDF